MSHSTLVLIGMLVLAAGLETAIFILSQPEIAGFRLAVVRRRTRSPRAVAARLGARTG